MDSDWIASIAEQSVALDGQKIPSKQERIEKRQRKKRKYDEQKNSRYYSLSQSLISDPREPLQNQSLYKQKINEKKLSQIKTAVEKSLYHIQKTSTTITDKPNLLGRKSTSHIYTDPESKIKGKAVTHQQLTYDNIQPIKSRYGGLGLARPSLLLLLRDPSFIPKIEEEFSERE